MPSSSTLAAIGRFLVAFGLGLGLAAQAAPVSYSTKVAADLRTAVNASTLPKLAWAKSLSGATHVKVLIVATSAADPDLLSLRQAVLSSGGSVLYSYLSVRALAAMVPAAALDKLAARSDVVGISPNRSASRQASVLQDAAGAGTALGTLSATPLDGRGVGIAILDSGIDWSHKSFIGADGKSRVRAVVDIVALGRGAAEGGWKKGEDYSPSAKAGLDGTKYKDGDEKLKPTSSLPDVYGHGSHVASVAAGISAGAGVDSAGIATGANLYDVRVLDEKGNGNVADVLAGIDWVIQRARLSNIRVMNLSLGAASTDSFLTDPLARAARSAVAAGIVVVASAGNAGKDASGTKVFGAVSSPGNEPSVITVGAANPMATGDRIDDVMASFSSRGPTRGGFIFPSGNRWTDNLIKPDLVAPGNRIVGVLGTGADGKPATWNVLAKSHPELTVIPGVSQVPKRTVMMLSGTSVAAPAVAGAAAILLQANPGLTPPLVKAILQYTAQPLPAASLLEQGTGLLNIEGAVRLAQALRTDIAPAIAAGSLQPGANLLAPGRSLPSPFTTLKGRRFAWSQMVLAGGTHLVGGTSLFTRYQPIYAPGLTWARGVALKNTVTYLPATNDLAANMVPRAIIESNAPSQTLVTAGVRALDSLAQYGGSVTLTTPVSLLSAQVASGGGQPLLLGFRMFGNSLLGEGFILSSGYALGSGFVLREGFVLNEGFVLREGFLLSEGFVLNEGFILSEGFVLREGFILTEGFILNETLSDPASSIDGSYRGD